jgi:hypothetical protein
MDVCYSCAVLVRTQDHVLEFEAPVFRVRYRISWNKVDIAGALEIFKRLWCRFLVERVVVDRLPERLQILVQHRFVRAQNGLVIPHCRDSEKDKDDRHHDHQLDERKSRHATPHAALDSRVSSQEIHGD